MQIDQTNSGDAAVLALSGQFDRTEDERFATHVDVLLDEGRTKVVVDLSAATLVTSTGFGALLTSCRRLRQAGGDLVLVGMKDVVLKAFQLLELGGKVPSFPTREEAGTWLARVDAPPKPVEGGVPATLEGDGADPFAGTLNTVSEREVQFTLATGAGPLLKRGDRLRIRFALPGAGDVDGAHVIVGGVMPAGGATLIHAKFDLLPPAARESIRRFAT